MRYFFLLVFSFLISQSNGSAQAMPEKVTHAVVANADGEEEISPVERIIHHVGDANHIELLPHIYIPLPCIIYNPSKKSLDVFMSSSLGEEQEYKGYIMHHDRVAAADGSKIYDFSITKNVFTMLLAVGLLFFVLFSVKKSYARNPDKAPKGLQSVFEPIFNYINDEVIKPNMGKNADKFAPYLLSVFFFILIINLIGLLPVLSANVSGNIAFTFSLAIFTFILTHINSKKTYWRHIFAMPGIPIPVLFILTPIEILGIFIKPFALMMRLFGNMISGHMVILSLVSLIFILGHNGESIPGALAGTGMAIPFVLFVSALELLVAFLQAYVFTLLSAMFIAAAMEEHHEEKHH